MKIATMLATISVIFSEAESVCARRARLTVAAENELTLKKCWPALRLRLLGLKMTIFDARVCQEFFACAIIPLTALPVSNISFMSVF